MPQTLANPVRLARLLDTHPYSIPGVHLCSDDGDWAFISEGGSLAFFHQPENLDQFTWGPGNYALPLNPGQTKRIPIGFPAVQPAEMLLDPAADFSDDVNSQNAIPGPEDDNDLIYIAGGRLGLWVMEAFPGPGYQTNFAARIDDSQDLDPTTQKSSRYCNGVEFVRLGTVDYLVAIFGFAKDSRLRFYRLSDVRQVVIDAALIGGDGFGAEIAPVHEVILGEHPSAPPWAYHTSLPNGSNPNAYAEPFALDVDIDADVIQGEGEAALYVAMGTHGIVRVKASATGSGAITSTTTWGPMFGTDCPGKYDDDDPATPTGQNTSGFPADRYVNIDWVVVDRNEHFGEVTRSDPPVFLDVAVQNDADGHFLYAAVDHLAWVRFDLDDTWTAGIPIDHHEGEDVSIQDNALFPRSNDVWFGASGVLKETAWDPPLVRAIAFQANFGFNLEIVAMPFCRELDVTRVERTPGVYESVLVALYRPRPWNLSSRGGRAPGFTYDNWFTRSGNTPATAAFLMQGLGATAFHWTTDITSGNSTQPSFDSYFLGGGSDLYLPPVHSNALTGQLGAIRLVHGRVTVDLPPAATPQVRGSCITYCLLDNGTPGGAAALDWPAFVRDLDEVGGRYSFGLGYAAIDPSILLTGFQEGGLQSDGLLYTPNLATSGPAEWNIEPLDGVHDDRGIVGILFEQESQWEGPSSTGTGTTDSLWTWGQKDVIGSQNHWRIDELPYTAPIGTARPDMDLGSQWQINVPWDRWEHNPVATRPEHMGGTVSEEYDAFTIQIATDQMPNLAAQTFVFASVSSTCDGIQLLARNQVMAEAQNLPSGGFLPFKDPRRPNVFPLAWETCQFDTHPEWGNFEALKYDINANFPNVASEWLQAKAWWRSPGTPLHLWAGATKAWPPELVKLRSSASASTRDKWVLVVPCGHACCPPFVNTPSAFCATDLLLPAVPTSFAPTNLWATNYNHGFLQLFDVSDPWQMIADSKVTVTLAPDSRDVFPSAPSNLDPLILPEVGSSAFRISTVVLGSGANEKVLVFVADFIGQVHCFDITDSLHVVTGNAAVPVDSWVADVSPLALPSFDRAGNNIRAIATDVIDDDEVMVYIGVSRVGIISIPYSLSGGFDTNAEHRIKTPGEVWGLEVRPDSPTTDRILLCSDAYCGMRIYGLVDLDPAMDDDTSGDDG